jgi:hypothetical protein
VFGGGLWVPAFAGMTNDGCFEMDVLFSNLKFQVLKFQIPKKGEMLNFYWFDVLLGL